MYNILKQLENTTKRTEKIAILLANQHNDVLKRVLYAALDPYTQYYIRKIPIYEHSAGKLITLSDFLDQLELFSNRVVTGYAAIEKLSNLLSRLSPDDAVVATRIITKDLRCGVQESTVNKVWKDYIPTYPCLLGVAYDDETIKNIVYPAFSQLKADGMRANIIFHNGQILIRARSGKVIDLLGVLDEPFKELFYKHKQDAMIDCELVVLETDGTIMNRKKGNGILNKAIKGTISAKEAKQVRARVWDIIPYADFIARLCKTPYKTRFETIKQLVGSSTIYNGYYELIDSKIVNSISESLSHFSDALQAGEEGVMLKNMNSPWEDKRSNNLIKLKSVKECELIVTGYQEGTGKYEGMLGALICQDASGALEVGIGSGFSDNDRSSITKAWIGTVVTVRFNEVITSEATNMYSLFLPRFVETRLDKDQPDHLTKILGI